MTDSTAKLGKIFIGGLSYETTDEKLRSYFGAYGSVTDAVVMKDPISRRSRGFGFITYADPSCVDRALAQPNHILDSRRVEAKRAVPRAESSRDSSSTSSKGNVSSMACTNMGNNVGATKKIFVGGLHYETKDADFKKYFQQYGKVVSAEVMFNRETNKSRGFGFVIFESEASVELVLQEKNHVIDGKSVEVKRAVPRTDVPPARSTATRAGSISGPSLATVEAIVGLDDTSCSVAAVATTSSSSSTSADSIRSMAAAVATSGSNGNAASRSNGTLSGYAAAVRFGSRGAPKQSLSSGSSGLSSTSDPGGASLDKATPDGVADALNSLAVGDANSPPHSTSSSIGSDKQQQALSLEPPNARASPSKMVSSPLDDPVMEQWNLSPPCPQAANPVAPSLPSLVADSALLAPGASSSAHDAPALSWQAAPWQQQWSSSNPQHEPTPLEQRAAAAGVGASTATTTSDHALDLTQPPPPTPSFFSMFGNESSGHSSTSGLGTWNSPSYVSTNSFGGMMGMGLGMEPPASSSAFSGMRNSTFGIGGGMGMGMGMGSLPVDGVAGRTAGAGTGAGAGSGTGTGTGNGGYGASLGGLLHPQDYLHSAEPELPLDRSPMQFGDMIGNLGAELEEPKDPLIPSSNGSPVTTRTSSLDFGGRAANRN